MSDSQEGLNNLFITSERKKPIYSMKFFMCILKCAKYPLNK